MRNTVDFKDKRVTIVGLARSGLACATLLAELGAEVRVTDSQETASTRSNRTQLPAGVRCELGTHSPGFIEGSGLVVVSPGVPDTSLAIRHAEKLGIPVVSEVEVAWMLCPATVIAVTGSNGKTTTTTLIGRILESAGKRVFICGNIGNPFAGEVAKMAEEDFVSLEISSFQLERIATFKPKVALILNFSCNHLDRYRTMQEYLDAKKRIFLNQDETDFAVLHAEDPALRQLAGGVRSRVVYFSRTAQRNPNQAAAEAVASIFGIDSTVCDAVFRSFRGIEHRLEFVAEIGGVKFVNDSKATTAESAGWALENIRDPIIMIAGGRHKGIDYSVVAAQVRASVKQMVLIGEAKEKIGAAYHGIIPVREAATLDEAVRLAFSLAVPGDCVLLSPMCSSFDMFSNYEERGRAFKEAVARLSTTKAAR